jgi:threonylcarbamoyladenosine tRNA methylthiotransferase MtaB
MRPDTVFGADFIAGFPTETGAMFDSSLSIVDECDLTYLHVFPFSPRKGTPAARMPQVPRQVAKERAARLREKGTAALSRFLASHAGTDVELLAENGGVGRTRHFAEMRLPPAIAAGSMIRARVSGHDGQRLSGEVIA